MNKQLTNHDIPVVLWLQVFTRDNLRKLANRHKIKRGRNAFDTAVNLKNGNRQDSTIATFHIELYIP